MDPDGAANTVMDVGYQYDNDGNPTWRYDALQNAGSTQWSQKYQYDQLNRLSFAMQGAINNWQGQGGQQSIAPQKNWVWNDTYNGQTYSLDAMGNFNSFYNNGTVDQRTHNTSNEIITRLLGGTAKNPSYDAAGNMIDDGEQYKFVYDFRNRLISVTTRDTTPKKVLDFAYDGLDRRIRKVSYATDGVTVVCDVRFLYDGQRIIEKRDHGNSDFLLARYVYGTQYIDEPIRMYRDSNLDGSFADPNDNFYFLQDRLFNVVALTDPDGVVQERVVYEPYGKSTCHRVSDGDETLASHFGNPYLFTGRELDSETGLYNYNHRYYSTALGRFINRDPISADVNLYRYCRDNPVIYVDPSGKLCRIATRCGTATISLGIPSGATHCGLMIEDETGTYALDGSGGTVNTFNREDNPEEWGTTSKYTDFPDSTCACIRKKYAAWNSMEIARDPLDFNSNWAIRCLIANCSITIPWKPGQEPFGWYGRTCVKKSILACHYETEHCQMGPMPCPKF